MKSYNTKDWELHAFLDWKELRHDEECTCCHGRGKVGGGFKDIDGPRQCPTCYGRGVVSKGPTTPRPELPPALVEHMRRAWWDFMNKE